MKLKNTTDGTTDVHGDGEDPNSISVSVPGVDDNAELATPPPSGSPNVPMPQSPRGSLLRSRFINRVVLFILPGGTLTLIGLGMSASRRLLELLVLEPLRAGKRLLGRLMRGTQRAGRWLVEWLVLEPLRAGKRLLELLVQGAQSAGRWSLKWLVLEPLRAGRWLLE